MECFYLALKAKKNFPFMIQLSWVCFSDSGYYYDDKKDKKEAKKLDSGYY